MRDLFIAIYITRGKYIYLLISVISLQKKIYIPSTYRPTYTSIKKSAVNLNGLPTEFFLSELVSHAYCKTYIDFNK